jgi:hypothetical protein
MRWIHGQREHQVAWADVARLIGRASHTLNERALRRRYHRWHRQGGQSAGELAPAA